MSKQGQRLRALVNERLSAAAEEIFALFERTIAEYEEELRRSKEENQRKQKTLDSVLSPRVLLPKAAPHTPSPDPGLTHDSTWSPQVKHEPEEQCLIKLEEEQQLVSIHEFSDVHVKVEEPSVLVKSESKQETKEEDMSTEPHLDSESEEDTEHSSDTDTGEDWRAPLRHPADENDIIQIKIRSPKSMSAPELSSSLNDEGVSGTAEGAEEKKHQCSVCKKKLSSEYQLQVHFRVHSGNNPYTCPICKRALASKTSLIVHTKQHTREKPHICSKCNKSFATKTSLMVHAKQHTEGKTFSCLICKKDFAQACILKLHMKSHSDK
ncbi:hypothetical protein NL108_010974 [Boleophthalmus pectinirostris]|uniref:zinc finger protein 37-like n=1 Tax=Boleophthalmus pectinirostris TaxID=150288 RepID=UPI00242B0B8A|nr:zinc finger protein 37-like [Boleophthalmus pectinirostris]KAJ0062373.1 hypothetical protein NL108_010974 [Boleophthalmus pectinirostris]